MSSSAKLAVLMSVFATGNAFAHTQTGILGAAAGATDVYAITCSSADNSTDHLVTAVRDLLPKAAPWISVQVLRGAAVRNTTDAVDGDTAMSPEVKTPGGDGTYTVIVDKTAAGKELYSLEFHCQSKSGEHTDTEIGIVQNQ